MPELKENSNCIGYALWRAGLLEEEKFIKLPILEEWDCPLEQVGPEEAQIIGIVLMLNERSIVCHLGFVDPENPELIWERNGVSNNPIEKPITVKDFLDQSLRSDRLKPVFLKVSSDL